VYWVTGDLVAYKMSAKHKIKDILGLSDRIYGLSEDSTFLYEWKPTLDSRKGEAYTVTTCNYTANIFQLSDPLTKYSSFCDLPSAGYFAAMYFAENEQKSQNSPSILKTDYLTKTAHVSPRRDQIKSDILSQILNKKLCLELNPTQPNEIKEKCQKMKFDENNEEIESPNMLENKEYGARKVYEKVLERNRREIGNQYTAKEDFKAGVGAFKSYLKAKRGKSGLSRSPNKNIELSNKKESEMMNNGLNIQLIEYPISGKRSKSKRAIRKDEIKQKIYETLEDGSIISALSNQPKTSEIEMNLNATANIGQKRNTTDFAFKTNPKITVPASFLNPSIEDLKSASPPRHLRLASENSAQRIINNDKNKRIEGIANNLLSVAEKIKALRNRKVQENLPENPVNTEELQRSPSADYLHTKSLETLDNPNQQITQETPKPVQELTISPAEQFSNIFEKIVQKLDQEALHVSFKRILRHAEQKELQFIVKNEVKESKKKDILIRFSNLLRYKILCNGWLILLDNFLLQIQTYDQLKCDELINEKRMKKEAATQKIYKISHKILLRPAFEKMRISAENKKLASKGISILYGQAKRLQRKQALNLWRICTQKTKTLLKLNQLIKRKEIQNSISKWKSYRMAMLTSDIKKQNSVKFLAEFIKRQIAYDFNKFSSSLAIHSAESEINKLQSEYEKNTKSQLEKISEKDTTIQELTNNVNSLGKYKTKLQNVVLKHFLTILVAQCSKRFKKNFSQLNKNALKRQAEKIDQEVGQSIEFSKDLISKTNLNSPKNSPIKNQEILTVSPEFSQDLHNENLEPLTDVINKNCQEKFNNLENDSKENIGKSEDEQEKIEFVEILEPEFDSENKQNEKTENTILPKNKILENTGLMPNPIEEAPIENEVSRNNSEALSKENTKNNEVEKFDAYKEINLENNNKIIEENEEAIKLKIKKSPEKLENSDINKLDKKPEENLKISENNQNEESLLQNEANIEPENNRKLPIKDLNENTKTKFENSDDEVLFENLPQSDENKKTPSNIIEKMPENEKIENETHIIPETNNIIKPLENNILIENIEKPEYAKNNISNEKLTPIKNLINEVNEKDKKLQTEYKIEISKENSNEEVKPNLTKGKQPLLNLQGIGFLQIPESNNENELFNPNVQIDKNSDNKFIESMPIPKNLNNQEDNKQTLQDSQKSEPSTDKNAINYIDKTGTSTKAIENLPPNQINKSPIKPEIQNKKEINADNIFDKDFKPIKSNEISKLPEEEKNVEIILTVPNSPDKNQIKLFTNPELKQNTENMPFAKTVQIPKEEIVKNPQKSDYLIPILPSMNRNDPLALKLPSTNASTPIQLLQNMPENATLTQSLSVPDLNKPQEITKIIPVNLGEPSFNPENQIKISQSAANTPTSNNIIDIEKSNDNVVKIKNKDLDPAEAGEASKIKNNNLDIEKYNEEATELKINDLDIEKLNATALKNKSKDLDIEKSIAVVTKIKKENLDIEEKNDETVKNKNNDLDIDIEKSIAVATKIKKEDLDNEKHNIEAIKIKKEDHDNEKSIAVVTKPKKEDIGIEKNNDQAVKNKNKDLDNEKNNVEAAKIKKEDLDIEKSNTESTKLKKENLDIKKYNDEATKSKKEDLDNEKCNAEYTNLKKETLAIEKNNDEAVKNKDKDLDIEKNNTEAAKLKKEELNNENYIVEVNKIKKENLDVEKYNAEVTKIKKDDLDNEKRDSFVHSVLAPREGSAFFQERFSRDSEHYSRIDPKKGM